MSYPALSGLATVALGGATVRPGSLWDALGATGDDFFAIKISYWLPVG